MLHSKIPVPPLASHVEGHMALLKPTTAPGHMCYSVNIPVKTLHFLRLSGIQIRLLTTQQKTKKCNDNQSVNQSSGICIAPPTNSGRSRALNNAAIAEKPYTVSL